MEEAGVEHFTLHDLRRTFRTFLSKLGVSREVSERCMNYSLKGGGRKPMIVTFFFLSE